jgi:hypothetical protein
MPRNIRLRHGKGPLNLADAHFAVQQQRQDTQTAFFGKCLQDFYHIPTSIFPYDHSFIFYAEGNTLFPMSEKSSDLHPFPAAKGYAASTGVRLGFMGLQAACRFQSSGSITSSPAHYFK